MSSLLDPTIRLPLTKNTDGSKDQPAAASVEITKQAELPEATVRSYDERLRSGSRWTPVTWTLLSK